MPHGPEAAGPRSPEGKEKKRKTTNIETKTRQRICVHLLVRDNTWTGPRKWRAGPYRARVSWASLPMSWAGPDLADKFENVKLEKS